MHWVRISLFRDEAVAISYSKRRRTGEFTQSDTIASMGILQVMFRISFMRWPVGHLWRY